MPITCALRAVRCWLEPLACLLVQLGIIVAISLLATARQAGVDGRTQGAQRYLLQPLSSRNLVLSVRQTLQKGQLMLVRAIIAALVLFSFPFSQSLAGPSSPVGSECRDLTQDKCEANSECFWKAEKNKCKKKEDKTEAAPSATPPDDAPQADPNQ
jgi:hypothetical protein